MLNYAIRCVVHRPTQRIDCKTIFSAAVQPGIQDECFRYGAAGNERGAAR